MINDKKMANGSASLLPLNADHIVERAGRAATITTKNIKTEVKIRRKALFIDLPKLTFMPFKNALLSTFPSNTAVFKRFIYPDIKKPIIKAPTRINILKRIKTLVIAPRDKTTEIAVITVPSMSPPRPKKPIITPGNGLILSM